MKKQQSRQHYHLHSPPFTDRLPAPVYFRTEHMPAQTTYPSLSHPWGEFVYSYSGVTEVRAQDQHLLAPAHLGIWIPAGVEHTGFNHRQTVHCSVYIARRLCLALPTSPCVVTVSSLLRALLEHLKGLPVSGANRPDRHRLLRVLVDQLAVCPTAGSYLPATDDPVLGAVLQALRDHPSDNRSVAELARAFFMSERTLMRRCQQALGITLTEWRQRVKAMAALELLQRGCSVEAAALELGYASTSAFIAMFRRLMGASPGRYIRDEPDRMA